ncbi:tRNA (adenosine(37)-N6)-threonylcarbamoyltransferase complex transferase subunit TsaD [Bartonella sp. DGB1]|uniref:tRNA (adenosine(37)-N6)-threonylcarbamoyltransferase complex transferase subunit TsaD n=1 Tax=Bartonella sp. DGB1 TaxID=3239807 RepID=UPI0035239958
MHILGIETSCDETAVAIIEYNDKTSGKILANIIYSQIKIHAPYGGVVPEIAARAHLPVLDNMIKDALSEANLQLEQIDAFAATAGPGLVGGLIVGLMTAKSLSLACNKPFIAVNHLEGHALTATLTNKVDFPYLLLLVSGGHTQSLIINSLGDYQRLGTTIDDALGEAFDKTAKLLGLEYPGGVAIEQMAKNGDPTRFDFPKPLWGEKRLDFSFSGLKTAVRRQIEQLQPLSQKDIADICASFQQVIVEILNERCLLSFKEFQHQYPNLASYNFVISGGVASNQVIRDSLKILANKYNFNFIVPEPKLCTDNAVMIAWTAAQYFANNITHSLDFAPKSRWPLDQKSRPIIGFGRKGAKA